MKNFYFHIIFLFSLLRQLCNKQQRNIIQIGVTLIFEVLVFNLSRKYRFWKRKGGKQFKELNVVDACCQVIFFFGGIHIIEFNVIIVAFFAKGDGFVDLDCFRELSVRFQVTSFLWRIFQDNICPSILWKEIKFITRK